MQSARGIEARRSIESYVQLDALLHERRSSVDTEQRERTRAKDIASSIQWKKGLALMPALKTRNLDSEKRSVGRLAVIVSCGWSLLSHT